MCTVGLHARVIVKRQESCVRLVGIPQAEAGGHEIVHAALDDDRAGFRSSTSERARCIIRCVVSPPTARLSVLKSFEPRQRPPAPQARVAEQHDERAVGRTHHGTVLFLIHVLERGLRRLEFAAM